MGNKKGSEIVLKRCGELKQNSYSAHNEWKEELVLVPFLIRDIRDIICFVSFLKIDHF